MKKFLLPIFYRMLYIFVLSIIILIVYLLKVNKLIFIFLNNIIYCYNNNKYICLIFYYIFFMIIVFVLEFLTRLKYIFANIFYKDQEDIIKIKRMIANIEKNIDLKEDKKIYFLIKDKK